MLPLIHPNAFLEQIMCLDLSIVWQSCCHCLQNYYSSFPACCIYSSSSASRWLFVLDIYWSSSASNLSFDTGLSPLPRPLPRPLAPPLPTRTPRTPRLAAWIPRPLRPTTPCPLTPPLLTNPRGLACPRPCFNLPPKPPRAFAATARPVPRRFFKSPFFTPPLPLAGEPSLLFRLDVLSPPTAAWMSGLLAICAARRRFFTLAWATWNWLLLTPVTVTCGGDLTCFLATSVKLQKMDEEVEFVPFNIWLASMHAMAHSMLSKCTFCWAFYRYSQCLKNYYFIHCKAWFLP